METSLAPHNIPPDAQNHALSPTLAGAARGRQTALVCGSDGSLNERVAQKLLQSGYQPLCRTQAQEALEAMKIQLFDLLVLTEEIASPAPAGHPLLLYLASLPMSTRRRIFVALVSSSLGTNDKLQAFYRSVNLIVNLQDMERLDLILKEARDEHDRFYHLFREVSIKVGRT